MSKSKEEVGREITCSIGEKELLTKEEAMAYAGVGRDTLKEWRDLGLPYRQYGRRIWFLKQDILDFMMDFELVGRPKQRQNTSVLKRANYEKNKRLLG